MTDALTRMYMAASDLTEDERVEAICVLARALTSGRGRIIEAAADSMSPGGKHNFAAGPWVAVTERMPSEREEVLFHDAFSEQSWLGWCTNGTWSTDEYTVADGVTHWAPIYAPPSALAGAASSTTQPSPSQEDPPHGHT